MTMDSESEAVSEQVTVHELRYGKFVTSLTGPVAPGSTYVITARSPGLPNPSSLMPHNLLPSPPLSSADIEPDFAASGALVFKGIAGGLAAMRVKFRPEDGEEGSSRAFMIAKVLFVPEIDTWESLPVGFFGWCEDHLKVTAQVIDQPTELPSHRIDLPRPQRLDETWFAGVAKWRQTLAAEAFRYIYHGSESTTVMPAANGADVERPESLAATDLDRVVGLLQTSRDRGLRPPKRPLSGFCFTIGIKRSLTSDIMGFVHQGATPAPHPTDTAPIHDFLRQSVAPRQDPEQAPLESLLTDSKGRQIGLEAIDLSGWLSDSISLAGRFSMVSGGGRARALGGGHAGRQPSRS